MKLSPAAAVAGIAARARGGKVFLSAGPAEPLALHDAWRADPDSAAGITFAGLFIPGINRFDYASLHPRARMQLFMLSPDWRGGFTEGRSPFRPQHYSQCYATLVREGAEVGVFHVSPPDAQDRCSFGMCADAPPAMLSRVGWKLAIVNPAMPAPRGAPRVDLAAFDAIVEVDQPLATLESPTPAGAEAIAARVSALVEDGDTVQTGVGKLPIAVTTALSGKRDLRIHSGLLAPSHLALIEAGAVRDAADAVVGGIAAGDAAFYACMGAEPRLKLVGVPDTHGHEALAAIPRLVAINAALEVDLLGQINAETAGAAQISGTGGLMDFVRGARASKGGRAIVMVQAETRGASRVVPLLKTPPTIARTDAPIVVTEHGAANLAALDIDARAEAIIALAAPAHRATLADAWREMRKAM